MVGYLDAWIARLLDGRVLRQRGVSDLRHSFFVSLVDVSNFFSSCDLQTPASIPQ